MENCQSTNRNHDHRTLEDHEQSLIVGDTRTKAFPELINTEAATNEDEDGCDSEACDGIN